MPTNPVVVRRVTAMLAKAGLIGTRAGANGGAWLLEPAKSITLDRVLRAVGACAHLGCPPPGAKGCPVGERIPVAVRGAIAAADRAAAERLSHISVADLLNGPAA
jgi:DNA-binding IscR family transcriptional regulator